MVGEIEAGGGQARSVPFDVTDYDAVSAAIAEAGPVDILVNNAGNAGAPNLIGSFDMSNFVDTAPDTWDRYVKINFYGVLNCVHAALPGMIDGGWGRVITLISDRRMPATCAPRTAAPRREVRFHACDRPRSRPAQHHRDQISLATMNNTPKDAPPPTDEQNQMMTQVLKQYIVRRRGEPDDVAAMVCFLASDLSSWITGQTYPVNGGYTLSL